MSPPPPNKGKAPITEDGDLSDTSSHPIDAEYVDGEVISSRHQEEDKKPDSIVPAQLSSRGSLQVSQETQGEKCTKLNRASPSLRRGSTSHSTVFDAEFSHSQNSQKSSSPLDLTKKKKKKKATSTGADGFDAFCAAASGEDAQNLLLAADRNVKSETSQNEVMVRLGHATDDLALEKSSLKSEGDTESSTSNSEDGPTEKNEDRTKKVQTLIVDRIMSSFMSWLDTRKKMKQEEEEENESQIEALFEAVPGGDAADGALFESVPAMPASVSASVPSSSRHELESFMYRQVPAPRAPAPVTRHRNSNIAIPPPPPRTSSIESPLAGPPLLGGPPPLGIPPPPVGGSQLSATYVPSYDSMVDLAGIPPLASGAPPVVPAPMPTPQAQSRSGYTDRRTSDVNKGTSFRKRGRPPVSAPRSFVSAASPPKLGALSRASVSSYGAVDAHQPAAEVQADGARQVAMHTGKRGRKANPLIKHDRSAGNQAPDEDEDEQGEGNRLPRAKLSKVQEDVVEGAKLACPFFKYNPRKYKTQRPCCGPGWDYVHRIKEHIYRKHSLPKFSCPRCSQSFETQLALQAHARSLDACDVREPEVLDGITQDQEKKLRSRKKTSAKELTEGEKWSQVYSIIFPDVREREIPSPYHNAEDADTNLGGYEDYLRRELPPLVRRQLEKEVERELSFVEEGMKQKVIDIARNLQLTLFKGYQQLENQERGLQDPPSVIPSSSSETGGSFFTATDTSPSTMTTSGTTPEIPDPLDIFGDPAIPDFDFNFLADIPFPESQSLSKGQTLDLGFDQHFDIQQPATIKPGMEMLGAQQHDPSYYGVDGYQDTNGQRMDASVLSYVP